MAGKDKKIDVQAARILELEKEVEELKKVKDSDNIEEIKTKTSEASQAIQKAGAELYKEAPQPKKEEEKKDDNTKKES